MVKEKKEKDSSDYKKTISRLNTLRKESAQREIELKEKIREGKRLGMDTGSYKEKAGKETLKQLGYDIVKTSANVIEVTGKSVKSFLSKPLLKKPHAKVKTISNKALMKSFANSGYTMFKSEPKSYSEQPEQDNRSMFFQAEFNKEKRRML